MRVAHISFSTESPEGRTAIAICESLQNAGHAALLCYAHGGIPETVPSYRIGGQAGRKFHAAMSRVFDCAGFLSRRATVRLTRQLQLYKPDIVHLHTLHGYYLNLPLLFNTLKAAGVPVVWTLTDCWPFTGHCTQYAMAHCVRFQTGCHHCPNKRLYPPSLGLDRSKRNWLRKRALITALDNLTLIAPSEWMARELNKSFLASYPLRVIPGGIDLNAFHPAGSGDVEAVTARYGLRQQGGKPILLSVAGKWRVSRGINDLMDLHEELKHEAVVAVVGLTSKQMEYLPPGMIAIPVIYGLDTLRALYTAADLCLSLRYEEAQDLTLVEALACGTQVVCYNQTSLPEAVTEDVGAIVPTSDVAAVADACRALLETPKDPLACIARAQAFDREAELWAYRELYDTLVFNARRKHEGAD